MAGQHFNGPLRQEPRHRPAGNSLPPACDTPMCGMDTGPQRLVPVRWFVVVFPEPDGEERRYCSGRCASRAIARHDLQATG